MASLPWCECPREVLTFNADDSRASTHMQIPSLQGQGNGMLILLCYCTSRGDVGEALRAWANSPEGRSWYQRTMTALLKAQVAEQLILTVLALVCYLRLCAPDEASEPVNGSYLWDFGDLLDGQQLKNQRAVWERMASSIRRVVGESYHQAFQQFLNIDFGVQRLHWLDGFSDQYWFLRLGSELTHEDAWVKTQRGFEEE